MKAYTGHSYQKRSSQNFDSISKFRFF